MYDLVYPLGVGSLDSNFEIKYSIRSFEKYFSELGKIFIVGIKPDFLDWNNSRLIHIPCDDPYRHAKDANIINKILQACRRDDLSSDFIRSSDDQIILKSIKIDDFYPKYLIDLNGKKFPQGNLWYKRLEETAEALIKLGKTSFCYDSHFPMLCNKQSFIDIMQDHINEFTVNTYYFNCILDEHRALDRNLKATFQSPVFNQQDLLDDLKGRLFLGFNNKGVRDGILRIWIENEYDKKSSFEL